MIMILCQREFHMGAFHNTDIGRLHKLYCYQGKTITSLNKLRAKDSFRSVHVKTTLAAGITLNVFDVDIVWD